MCNNYVCTVPRFWYKFDSYFFPIQPLYDTIYVRDGSKDPDYEPFYSTVDDDGQPIYSVPDGEDEFTSDEDSEYMTPTEEEGTPPPLPPRTEVCLSQQK